MNISSLLLPDSKIRIVHPELLHHFNKSQAIFIQQLHYWIQKGSGVMHEGRRWVYNTAEEWGNQIMICERQARRIISSLKDLGVLLVQKLSRFKSDRTNYFTIDYDVLEKILSSNLTSSQQTSDDQEANSSAVVVDKMSGPLGQNVRMVNHRVLTKIENKLIDMNDVSYEEGKTKPCTKTIRSIPTETAQQIKQVRNDFINRKEIGEGDKEDESKRPPRNTTAQDMLEIWNQHFPDGRATMTKDLAKYLVATFKALKSDLRRWTHYCGLIASSSYMRSNKFSLSLHWAIKFTTMERIFKGEFGVDRQDLVYKLPYSERTKLAEEHIESIAEKESEEGTAVRKRFLKRQGPDVYFTWLADKIIHIRDGRYGKEIYFEGAHEAIENYMRNKFFFTNWWQHLLNDRSNPHTIWGSRNAA